ncbi:MAG: hypothetical protein UY41_C0004G0011 [Candidatus Moranbacteria bacterium GW2011_GWE1_49_15]|nr:MAG: hypothetical protein UX75_C0005G0013 [Candidatus Moranbacteria bacterium GW2011_GWE2_47_10]KKW07394.1 MAG: hypothetical protein UY41_C0004G0011 [Candidatus Moranbacteria bacterium GW2011_GWE1_49_15]
MSLIELLVAIAILGIVMAGLNMFFAYMWKTRLDEVNRGQSSIIASNSVSKMAENIRRASQADSGSYAIALADDFELIFYTDIDSDQYRERVHYYLDGTSLMMGTAEPILGDSPTYPADDEVISAVATSVTNTETEPIFTYYNAAGSLSDTPATVSPIRRIGLSISINTDPSKISNVLIQTSVSPRNLNK